MKKVMAKLEVTQELEVGDKDTLEDMETQFKEVLGEIFTELNFEKLMTFTEVRKIKRAGKITLDELADDVVLPNMMNYPGKALTLDFILEKAHHADHRANETNVRLALGKLQSSGDVLELSYNNEPGLKWMTLKP